MLPPILLVADTNFLRSADLRAFLGASAGNAIALDRLVLFEIFKKNPFKTSQESLRIASEYPNQIYAIKPTHIWLEKVVSNESDLEEIIDAESTKDLRALCVGLTTTPLPEKIAPYLAARESEAVDYMQRLSNELSEYENALRERAEAFSQSELTEIRTGNAVSERTREKISDLLHEVTGHFILTYQEPNRITPLATATAKNMFAFRYALCVVLFYLDWVQQGRTAKSPAKRQNDVIDLQIATVATFFSGIASSDIMTRTTAREAATILAKWGAFLRFVDQ